MKESSNIASHFRVAHFGLKVLRGEFSPGSELILMEIHHPEGGKSFQGVPL